MKQEQLKEPGHYRLSFRAALRYTLRARTDYFKDATSRVKFGDAAIFMPFIALVFGLALMVIAMISAVFMKNNFFASGAVVLFFIVFFHGFFNERIMKISWLDLGMALVFLTLADTAIAGSSYYPLLLSVYTGSLTILFACGLGKDLPMAPKSKRVCTTYKNEDYFFIVFAFIVLAVASILVMKNAWLLGFVWSLAVAAVVPHFIARADGGVTRQGIARGLLYGTTISYMILLLL